MVQGNVNQALMYWKECRDAFISLYMDRTDFVLIQSSTPGLLERIEEFFQRLVRLLFLFHSSVVSKVCQCSSVCS